MGTLRVDVLMVTALKEELDAVLGLDLGADVPQTWKLLRDPHGFPYHVREVRNLFGEVLCIAAAWSGEMGEATAAAHAVRLVDELDPQVLAMCGICAGKRGKVFLGDVIVADRVFSYDHGKLLAGSEEDGGGFFHDITTYNLEAAWRMEAVYFAQEFQKSWRPELARPLSKEAQERWLLLTLHAYEQGAGPTPDKHSERKARCPGWGDCIRELRRKGLLEAAAGVLRLTDEGKAWVAEQQLVDPDGEARDPDFRIHVAPLATGKTVREDPELFRRLERHVRKVLGVEMEAAAIGLVAARLGRRAIIAKAVSDYGDLDKDDAFREFACQSSAAFLLSFLRQYVRAREMAASPARAERAGRAVAAEGEPRESAHRDRRDEFLTRVERATRLREPPGTEIVRREGTAPFETYLEVMVRKGHFTELYPVGALERPITQEALEVFIREIHTHRYAWISDQIISTLVHGGPAASPELIRLAKARRINLLSFTEYQGLLDFSEYLLRQTERLENDPVYPPAFYVEQRGKVSVGGQPPDAVVEVLGSIRQMLDSPDPRFALVLGEFGTGKTFLLHELARRMGQEEEAALIPVLIEMRSLQKQRTLRELVAQHFASKEVTRFEVEKFLYMLREGRIALLFDGFDELALRVTYDQVLEHFRTLMEATEGRAKVIVTSRTQHFLTDHQVRQELARRAESLPGYRLFQLERFTEEQIHRFLVKRLGSEQAAAERLELLRDVKDLLGLAQNPRLLSFIIELEVEKLREARRGSGEITSAKLYELLIGKWLAGEHERVNPKGAPKGLSVEQILRGVTALARLLWGRTERTVPLDELPSEVFEMVSARGELTLEVEKVKHQLGSGSLLVRDEDGRFSFVHQSVMEWLVAADTAAQVRESADAPALGLREMSELMADFFVALAGPEVARIWAEWKVSLEKEKVAKRNALLVLGRLGPARPQSLPATERAAKNLENTDLRGQDLSGADLRGARLRGANLTGVPLVGADLTGAQLQRALLVRADLEGVSLRDADLSEANLSGARLVKADLRGAKLERTRFRMARLTEARVDSLGNCDVFGAALPGLRTPKPQLVGISSYVSACFSPVDGVLAIGCEDGTILLWDAETSRELRVLQGHQRAVVALAFNATGRFLASASRDGTVRWWNLAEEPLNARVEEVSATAVALSPRGGELAVGFEDGTVQIWRVGQPAVALTGHKGRVNAVAFSPDETLVASASDDSTVRLWRLGEQQSPQVLRHAAGPVTGLAFSPDGAALATSSLDGKTRFWSLKSAEELLALGGDTGEVLGLALSPDGDLLATTHGSGALYIWSLETDLETGEDFPILWAHGSPGGVVRGVTFSADGATLAYVSAGAVMLWEVPAGRGLGILERGLVGSPLRIAFTLREELVCASDDGSLSAWDVERGNLRTVSESLAGSVQAGGFSPEGGFFAAASEYLIEVRNVSSGQVVSELADPTIGVAHKVALGPHGEKLVVASTDGPLSVWNVSTGKRISILGRSTSPPTKELAMSPEGSVLATASSGPHIWLWEMSSRQYSAKLEGHEGVVQCLAFNSPGRVLASFATDGTLRFWDVVSQQQLGGIKVEQALIGRLRFDSEGRLLAAVLSTGRVALFHVESGQLLSTLSGHPATARDVAFQPGGRIVAVAYADGVVGLHEVKTGNCLARLLRLPEGWVALRSDGRFKASGNTGSAFWYAISLCRFEPHELSAVFPGEWRIPYEAPLLAPVG